MVRHRRRTIWSCERLEDRLVLAASSIDPNPAGVSDPAWPTEIEGVLYFVADDGIHGRELWRTDGSIEGTQLVLDIHSGPSDSDASDLVSANGTLFLLADDGIHGTELWMSDGTAEGTVLVKDIAVGELGSNAEQLIDVGGELFFVADDREHGLELWKSDGTDAGTVLVTDIRAGEESTPIAELTAIDGLVYFSADDGTVGAELWKSDGSSQGTQLVLDIQPGPVGSDPEELTNLDGLLMFVADSGPKGVNGEDLWRSDGTAVGTHSLLSELPERVIRPKFLTAVGTDLFFSADTEDWGTEPWKSDGTAAGTQIFKDWNLGSGSSNPRGIVEADGLGAVKSSEYFYAFDPVSADRVYAQWAEQLKAFDGRVVYARDRELFHWDGVVTDTINAHGLVRWFHVLEGQLVFSGGRNLWSAPLPPVQEVEFIDTELQLEGPDDPAVLGVRRSSSIGPTRVEVAIHPNSARQGLDIEPIVVDFLDGESEKQIEIPELADEAVGQLLKSIQVELRKVNPLVEIVNGIATVDIASVKVRLVVGETAGITRLYRGGTDRLFVSLNAEPQSEVVVRVNSSDESAVMTSTEVVRFDALNWNGLQAVELHGVRNDAWSVISLSVDPMVSDVNFQSAEKWELDVGVQQLGIIADLDDSVAEFQNPTSIAGKIYFGTEGKIWSANPSGVDLVKDLPAQCVTPQIGCLNLGQLGQLSEFTPVRERFYFVRENFDSLESGGTFAELWMSDGSEDGTRLVHADFDAYFPDNYQYPSRYLTALGGNLIYELDSLRQTSGVRAVDLLVSHDGTSTTILRQGIEVRNMVTAGQSVYFGADDGDHGRELWITDGTPEGTRLIKDIRQGPENALFDPSPPPLPSGYFRVNDSEFEIVAFGDRVIFAADDGSTGTELWISDGTDAGTFRLLDISPSGGSDPSNFLEVGDLVFFTATDNQGFGLWRTDGTTEGTVQLMTNFDPREETGQFQAANGLLYFTTKTDLGSELWSSDGTVAGTHVVKDIKPGASGSDPGWLTYVKGDVYFVARQNEEAEIWKTDGTEIGTQRVLPGVDSPSKLIADSTALYFVAADRSGRRELWSYVPEEDRRLGDIDRDGIVGLDDYAVLAANFGETSSDGHAAGDLNDDGRIDFGDFLLLSAEFQVST